MNVFVGMLLASLILASAAGAQDLCEMITGASVIADDGTFLGKLTNQYFADSILNEHGTHGSPYSPESIWNQYSQYGGKYSSLSSFNPYTSSPPVLIKRGKVMALLSVNKSLRGTVNPYIVKSCDF